MKDIILSSRNFMDYIPKNQKEYRSFIRLILKYADTVCFTVRPWLDSLDEFRCSIWSEMRCSIADYGFAQAASDPKGVKSSLILFKKDYCLCDFLQHKNGIFDFTEEDPGTGIRLDDPAFLKNGEVFLYTVTHGKMCAVTEDVCSRLLTVKERK